MTLRPWGAALALITWTVAVSPTLAQPSDEAAQPAAWSRVVQGGFENPQAESLGPLAEFQGQLYVGTYDKAHGCQVWRTPDGKRWEVVVGSSAGTPSGFGDAKTQSISKFAVFHDQLYAATWNEDKGGGLWRSIDGRTWESVVGGSAATAAGFGKLENSGITALGVFQNALFAGTGSLYCKDGVELWMSSDGVNWQPVAGERVALRTELARESKYFLDMAVFHNALYLATGDQRTGGSEIWRTQDSTSWETVVGAPSPYRAGMGNLNHDMIYDLAPFHDHLYAAVMSFAREGGALWRTADGVTWEVIAGEAGAPYAAGFGNTANFGFISLAAFEDQLYVGTSNEQGAQLWKSGDGTQWQPVVCPECVPSGGFGTAHNRAIQALRVFKGRLYAATHNPPDGGELWRVEPRPTQDSNPDQP